MMPAHRHAHRFEKRVEGVVQFQQIGQQHEQLVVAAAADRLQQGLRQHADLCRGGEQVTAVAVVQAAACTERDARRGSAAQAGRKRRRPPAAPTGRPAPGRSAPRTGRRTACDSGPDGDDDRKSAGSGTNSAPTKIAGQRRQGEAEARPKPIVQQSAAAGRRTDGRAAVARAASRQNVRIASETVEKSRLRRNRYRGSRPPARIAGDGIEPLLPEGDVVDGRPHAVRVDLPGEGVGQRDQVIGVDAGPRRGQSGRVGERLQQPA